MFNLILQAIVPVAFVLILGYLAGRTKLISQEGARNFSTYVVDIALPCALFVGVFGFSPNQLEDVPYLLTILLALLVPFIIAIIIGLTVFKKSWAETSLFACNCGFPDMAYFGLPVLFVVVGNGALLPIIVGNLVTSILIVPPILLMIHHHEAQSRDKGAASIFKSFFTMLKQPVVWAPILGVILVLLGFHLPHLVHGSIRLVGNTTGGVALFTLGVLLSNLKFKIEWATIVVLIPPRKNGHLAKQLF